MYAEYFGKEPAELLGLDDINTSSHSEDTTSLGDWQIEMPLGPVKQAPNGLQYRLFKLVSSSDNAARGKRYVLDHLSSDERRQVQEHLLRHTNVCNQVGDHPNITRHIEIKSAAGADLWWVIDEWLEGERLDKRIQRAVLAKDELLDIMAGIAAGLDCLHRNNVIMRQLSPLSVILRESTQSPVLVDFEMAKLLDRRPTVSPKDRWPDDDYRAPEVGGPRDPLPAADAYSWARILLHAASGSVPPAPGDDVVLLGQLDLPKSVAAIASKCLQLDPKKRPNDMTAIRRALQR
jgi:serine/threonine protein kinase